MNTTLLKNRLEKKESIILDGAVGTEILHHGIATTLPLWSAEALLTSPTVVQKIHEAYILAGAEIITTNTFRTTARAFKKNKLSAKKASEMSLLACYLAKEAIEKIQPSHPVYIAGSVAPLEDCYSPELTPTNEQLNSEHYQYIYDLKAGGADFIFLETMITIRETKAALEATKKLRIPVAVSFCVTDVYHLLSGDSLSDAVKLAEDYHPLFIGVNCVSPEIATKTVQRLKTLTTCPISVYAQGDGKPEDTQGWKFEQEKNIDTYITFVNKWIMLGAQIIGGCCGTTPAHIAAIRKILALST